VAIDVKVLGLEQLQRALRDVPDHIDEGAANIVKLSMNEAASDLKATYPLGPPGRHTEDGTPIEPGALRAGVKKRFRINRRGYAVGTVRSLAPHSHLYEFGTAFRQTAAGWNRGRVKSFEERGMVGLVGIAERERREMQSALYALVRNAGFLIKAGQ
jgi:hypothetical protein